MNLNAARTLAVGQVARTETRPQAVPLNIDDQMKWHTCLTDQFKNFYRTSYQDMILGREVAVKSVKPEGYGGYDVYRGANELYRNTEFARMQQVINNDDTRFRLPDFTRQKEGVPDFTTSPQGKSAKKTAHTLPSGFVVPPYSVDQYGPVLNLRSHVPILQPYMERAAAAPQRAVQPSSSQATGRPAQGTADAPAPSKLSVQTDLQEEAAGAGGHAVATSPESARLTAVATYVLNNGTRSPRKSESPRKNPTQLLS